MLKERLTGLKSKLDECDIFLTFSGPLTQEVIEMLGEAIKINIMSDTRIKSNTVSIFSVFIEQTQNVRNYLSSKCFEAESPEFHNSGMVVIGRADDRYFVCSGNMITKEDTRLLTTRIDELNSMDKGQLKAAYKSQMKKPREMVEGEPGGAGLGLLEIARKASAAIEYMIMPRDDIFDYIIINVYI
ncbi:MAG: SiaB family protein kinase [Syntrophomonas sp.]